MNKNEPDAVVVINGVRHICFRSPEPEQVQEEPKRDPRLTWGSGTDEAGDKMELFPGSVGGNGKMRVIVKVETELIYRDAPQLYAAALAYVRAGMALEGIEENSICLGSHQEERLYRAENELVAHAEALRQEESA